MAGPASGMVLSPPPSGQIYHAAFPDFGGPEDRVTAERIAAFEGLAGRPVAWAYFSDNWTDGIRFPGSEVATISAAGRVPFIRMMARSDYGEGGPDERYTMQSILDGAWDPDLRAWCAAAAAVPVPLLVEFGTEVNGEWFPWNRRWNGGGEAAGYGDPSLADGPERFRDAYRRIVDLCRAEGADNLTWFFHVDVGSYPDVDWNRDFANYYPATTTWTGSASATTARSRAATAGRASAPASTPSTRGSTRSQLPAAHRSQCWSTGRGKAAMRGRRRGGSVQRSSPSSRGAGLEWSHSRIGTSAGETRMARSQTCGSDSSREARRAYRAAIAAGPFTSDPLFNPGQ